MKSQQKLLSVVVAGLCLVTSNAMLSVSSGGSMVGGSMPWASAPQETPREKAVDSYNQGIRYRDKAWSLAEDLGSASSDKARSRLEREIAKQHKTSAIISSAPSLKYPSSPKPMQAWVMQCVKLET